MDVQRLRVEVIVAVVDFFQDGVALGGTAGLALLEVSAEDVFDDVNVGGGVGLHYSVVAVVAVVTRVSDKGTTATIATTV